MQSVRYSPLMIVVYGALSLGNLSMAEPPSEAKTLLSERGKRLLSNDFGQPLDEHWSVGVGKWEIVDGALKGTERKSDDHDAAARHPLSCHDLVIQCSVRLDGAQRVLLKLNGVQGHCCQLALTPSSLTLQKHHNDAGEKQLSIMQKRELPIQPGTWHTLVLEIRGREVLGALDEKTIAFGEHDSIDVDKRVLILNVTGESASFKNLRIWEALPNKDWKATKSKLVQRMPPSHALR